MGSIRCTNAMRSPSMAAAQRFSEGQQPLFWVRNRSDFEKFSASQRLRNRANTSLAIAVAIGDVVCGTHGASSLFDKHCLPYFIATAKATTIPQEPLKGPLPQKRAGRGFPSKYALFYPYISCTCLKLFYNEQYLLYNVYFGRSTPRLIG